MLPTRGAGEELSGVFRERIDPEYLGGVLVGVEFALVAFEAFAESEGGPVAGLVSGAFVERGIAEAFGADGAVSVFILEVSGKFAQGEAQAAGGKVGFAPGIDHKETAQLGDQGQAARPGERVPVDPFVAVLEAQGLPGPVERGTKHGYPSSPSVW